MHKSAIGLVSYQVAMGDANSLLAFFLQNESTEKRLSEATDK